MIFYVLSGDDSLQVEFAVVLPTVFRKYLER